MQKVLQHSDKKNIIDHLCYTELVYARINKKLKLDLSKKEIEKLILEIIEESNDTDFIKKGKNFYITNQRKKIRLTINSYTFRIITADVLDKLKT